MNRAIERRKSMIRAALNKWIPCKIQNMSVIYLNKHNAEFYRVSVQIANAKWLTTVSFSRHKGDEAATLRALRNEVIKAFGEQKDDNR